MWRSRQGKTGEGRGYVCVSCVASCWCLLTCFFPSSFVFFSSFFYLFCFLTYSFLSSFLLVSLLLFCFLIYSFLSSFPLVSLLLFCLFRLFLFPLFFFLYLFCLLSSFPLVSLLLFLFINLVLPILFRLPLYNYCPFLAPNLFLHFLCPLPSVLLFKPFLFTFTLPWEV